MNVVVSSSSFNASEALVGELKELNVNYFPWSSATGSSLSEFVRQVEADVLILGLESFCKNEIDRCPTLKFVAKYGVGKDNVDVNYLSKRGIGFGWSAGVNRRSVSELVLSFILGHKRNVINSVSLMKNGRWVKNGGHLLTGSTIGIVGLGQIGSDVARILGAFDCKILAYDIEDRSEVASQLSLTLASYEEILAECDVVTFHVPLNSETQKMLSYTELKKLRPDCLIINTSRGEVVDFYAAIDALKEGRIGGFSTDVFPEEPFDCSRYKDLASFYPTPHIGGNAHEAVLAMGRAAIDHVKRFLNSNKSKMR